MAMAMAMRGSLAMEMPNPKARFSVHSLALASVQGQFPKQLSSQKPLISLNDLHSLTKGLQMGKKMEVTVLGLDFCCVCLRLASRSMP